MVFIYFKKFSGLENHSRNTLLGLTLLALNRWIMFRFGDQCSRSFFVLGVNTLYGKKFKKLHTRWRKWATKAVSRSEDNNKVAATKAHGVPAGLPGLSLKLPPVRHTSNFWNISQVCGFFSIWNNCNRCLKLYWITVWMSVCLYVKGLVWMSNIFGGFYCLKLWK